MRRVLPFVAVFGFAAPFAAVPAHATSFSCAKATAPDTRAICNSADLSVADEKLAGLYKQAIQVLNGKDLQQLVASQHMWLGERATCKGDAVCITSEYDRRTKYLQSLLGTTSAIGVTKAAAAPATSALETFRRTGECRDCNLSDAKLSGIEPAAHADGGKLDCKVNGVASGTFDGARIDHANFVSCNTKEDSALDSMKWDGASLKGTNFTGSNLGGNSFKGANLTEANLSGATLYWVDMSNANLKGANLSGAKSTTDTMAGLCSNFSNAEFSGAKIVKARLCGTFYDADFSGANLRNTTITGTVAGLSAQAAKAQGSVATDANGYPVPATKGRFGGKINLTGADLRGARLFSETKLRPQGYAFAILCRTKMPDGRISNRDCK
jgi:uncharacterized protein YjbI with pentapeptide repeats